MDIKTQTKAISLSFFLLLFSGCTVINIAAYAINAAYYRVPFDEKVMLEKAGNKAGKNMKYPVLVVTIDEENASYNLDTIDYRILENYIKDKTDYSFLIPQGFDDPFDAALKKRCCYDAANGKNPEKDPWYMDLQVERTEPGKQLIRLECSPANFDKQVFWYEATDKEVTPLYYASYFMPGMYFNWILPSFVLALFLSIYLRRFFGKKATETQIMNFTRESDTE